MSIPEISRRRVLAGFGAGASAVAIAGCDQLNSNESFRSVLKQGDSLHYRAQRLLSGSALAPEYALEERSPTFRTNGNTMPTDPIYKAHLATGFASWQLIVDGLVRTPLRLSLSDLMSMPARTQVTRHDCVEGWSAIGQWTGTLLKAVLDRAGLSKDARFIVFHCADTFGSTPYYESIDLDDAFHPQTILAWRMNGEPLPVGHGAPVRLRVERQLGYKHAKFVMRVEARDRIDNLYGGKGGYWEDHSNYQWYAGI